jgi:predicted nucleic acid-binding protein
MIVLDTNVVSETMRLTPNPAVIDWLNRQDLQTLWLTSVSLAELRFGIARLDAGRSKANLSMRLEQMLDQVFQGRIVAFDASSAQAFADRMAIARRNGHAVGFQDGLIAACTAARGFSVATRDTSPFAAMGLPVINPWLELAPDR